MYDSEYTSSRIESALYWAFGKNIFGFGVALAIYGYINKIGCKYFKLGLFYNYVGTFMSHA